MCTRAAAQRSYESEDIVTRQGMDFLPIPEISGVITWR